VAYYERNLPHWHPDEAALFLTWCLHGSVERHRVRKKPGDPGEAFAELDRVLDKGSYGPTWLRDCRIARCVQEALLFGERQLDLYSLIAWVIMPNHVHVALLPKVNVARITKSIKGFTARQANALLGRTGERFWQDEVFDHWVRNEGELQEIIGYIERNPVRAGLAAGIEEWHWSSAHRHECLCH
jgi:REP element-mobilizing transposase RayT